MKRHDAALPPPALQGGELAIVLTGGGARAAYQVGVLRCLGRHRPELRFPIVTGVSAGGINAAFLAADRGSLHDAAERLHALWTAITVEDVFKVDVPSLGKNLARWGTRLVSGGLRGAPRVRGLVDSSPLRRLLRRELGTVDGEIPGIADNLGRGHLKAVALTTLSYSTGQTITWVEGRGIQTWDRPNRRAVSARLSVDHVMASAALPILFPAVRIGRHWYGDGGVRLSAPLSPALHLGARRLLTLSTRYQRTMAEADRPQIDGYPPPAQILGHLLNAVFLDVIDEDVRRVERLDELIAALPPERRQGMEHVDLLVLRPSADLGRLAADYEPRLPRAFRFLTRGLGTQETRSPDFLSILMFQEDYLKRLLELGERDADERRDELLAFVDASAAAPLRRGEVG
jgi:NTE family protein